MNALKALIVDDEVDFLETLLKRMKKRRIDVTGATGATQALALLDAEPFDVVVLDVRMPEMDGITLLQQIKQRFGPIEVIMLTGHASLEVAVKGMELGAFDYLMKPVDIDELIYKLQDAYQKRVLQSQKIQQIKSLKGGQ